MAELKQSSDFVEVRFLDREHVLSALRQAAAEAKARYPEIVHVWLFGSLVQGNWTADSDADLFVVVRKSFKDLFDRVPYQIFTSEIPTDSLVYSQAEFETLARDPESIVAQSLHHALEL